jgi:hypothetical protein
MRCTPTIHELIVLTLPPRHRCPLDRLPASRLLLPRSGLERSDFVPWHETDHRCRSGDVRCSGKTGSGVSGPSGQLLCRFSDAGMRRLSTRCGGRRPKSANARSRGKLGTGWQRVLWGFNVGADLDDERHASTTPARCLETRGQAFGYSCPGPSGGRNKANGLVG